MRSVLNVEKLKNKARKLEQRDEPAKAIEVYLQILRSLEGKPELDNELGLYNKVGDLYLKGGNVNGAVEMYERAVNRYIDSGYPNNAIALCNKVLRSAPGRNHVYLTLGRLMLQRGFVAEAKKNLVEYAQRMSDAGRLDEAFGALKTFADISPGNEEIRLMLAEQLRLAARDQEAIEQIDKLMSGSTESARRASEILEKVRAVDPEYDVDAAQPAPKKKGRSEDLIFIPLDDDLGSEEADEADAVMSIDIEQPPVVEDGPADTSSIPGLQTEEAFGASGVDESGPLDSEDTSRVGETEVAADEDLSFLSSAVPALTEEEAPPALAETDVPELDLEDTGSLEPDSDDSLVILNSGSDQKVVSSGPEPPASDVPQDVPVVSIEPQTVDTSPAAVDPLTALQARLDENPDDPQLRREFAEALIESGDRERGLEELDVALHRFEVVHDWSHAWAVTEEILRLEPNSIPHYQKRVEFAYRLNDKAQLVRAYLDLANAFFRSGSLDRAQAVYRRVLEHDEENGEAKEALSSLAPPAPEPAAAPGGSPSAGRKSEGYVDLGEFILGEDEDRNTRMRVEQDLPSGDEQQDFAEMLQQFKRGIEENLDEEDSQAHYDLGVAFREMGLLDEAISEFQKALRAPETRLQSAEMLGLCFIDKGQHEVAATVLRRAAESDPSSDQDKIGVLYWLARCEEAKARHKEALSYYRRVFAVDIHFEDVRRRVDSLVQAVEG